MKTQIQPSFSGRIYSLILPALFAILLTSPALLDGQDFFGTPVTDPFDLGIVAPAGGFMVPTLVDMDGDQDLDLFIAAVWDLQGGCFAQKSLDYYENMDTVGGCPQYVFAGSYPFGIPEEVTILAFADIDGNGTPDLFSTSFCAVGTNQILYCKNTGSATDPSFGEEPIQYNPFGLDPSGVPIANLAFGDIDNNGAIDAFINGRTAGWAGDYFLFQENTGSANAPNFADPVENPFGLLIPTVSQGPIWAILGDMDLDGDLDILNCLWQFDANPFLFHLYFHKNRLAEDGIVSFEAGVPLPEDPFLIQTLGDLDGDGDLDGMASDKYGGNILSTAWSLPEAGFTYEQEDPTVTFSNTSALADMPHCWVSWLWDFGDGSTSEEKDPVHVFLVTGTYSVCLTIFGNEDVFGAENQDTFCDTISITVGTREVLLRGYLQLYPNPAAEYLDLQLDTDKPLQNVSLSILDALGRQVWEDQVGYLGRDAIQHLDVSALPNGLYTLRLMQEGMVVGKQFVVVKD